MKTGWGYYDKEEGDMGIERGEWVEWMRRRRRMVDWESREEH